ncbi:MAG: hypothetical protein QOG45_852 [Chloroflexota bacterium]|nr:hypothetical protein [Chloroflexota bacterium]
MNARQGVGDVVLVHGGFVDGSGWQQVHDLLKKDGYNVSVVQNPTLSLEGDVAATKLIIDAHDGPVILVGHSYGGAVITEAGTHPKVGALVYIAAFAPDTVSRSTRSSPTRRPERRCRRFCLPETGSCSSTGRSSGRRSPAT